MPQEFGVSPYSEDECEPNNCESSIYIKQEPECIISELPDMISAMPQNFNENSEVPLHNTTVYPVFNETCSVNQPTLIRSDTFNNDHIIQSHSLSLMQSKVRNLMSIPASSSMSSAACAADPVSLPLIKVKSFARDTQGDESLNEHYQALHFLDTLFPSKTKNKTTVPIAVVPKPPDTSDDPMKLRPNKDGIYSCKKCSSNFKHKMSYRNHLIKAHGYITEFICTQCGKMFAAKYVLDIHEKTHSQEKSVACPFCTRTFKNKANLYIHKEKHHPVDPSKRYVCVVCQKIFATKTALRTHLSNIHRPTTNPRPHICPYCGSSFTSKNILNTHMLNHTQQSEFVCDFCDRVYQRIASLKYHIMTHVNIKPHKCTQCKKSFVAKSLLTQHKRVHSGEKPFQCRLCSQRFSQHSAVYRHMHFCHDDAPVYACNICGQGASSASALQKHHDLVHVGPH